MTHVSTLTSLAAVWAVVVLSPGPCFLVIVRHAASRPTAGVFVALGVETGTLLWCAASLLGLGVLFSTTPWLYDGLRIVGATYLLFLGVSSLRRSLQPKAAEDAGTAETTTWYRAAWKAGFMADISNPKAAVFFGALFASLLEPPRPVWLTLAAVGVIVAIEFCWYCTVAYLFRSRRVSAAYRRAERCIDAAMSVSFALLATRLVVG